MERPAYGFKEPMENDAMVRTLDAQARAIWPQERSLIARAIPRPGLDVLDVGSGTGEIAVRVAREFAPRSVTGIDLSASHVEKARARAEGLPGVTFQTGDALHLPFPDRRFDAAICRHLLHAVPDPEAILREMIRVVKPGGWLYTLAEDYGMLYFHPSSRALDEFFLMRAAKAGRAANSNILQGRTMPVLLESLGCTAIVLDYLCVDTLRVDRTVLAEIFVHWRDGFDDWISKNAGMPVEEVRERFNAMASCARGPNSYAGWLIPCLSAKTKS